MNLKTLRKLAVTSTVLAGVAAIGISGISAAAPTGNDQSTQAQERSNPMSSLINAIAQKFNLNASDVQKIFEEQRTQMETQRDSEHTARAAERLTQAVSEGKLTQAQANLLKAKQAEMKAFHESLKGKTHEECKAAMDAKLAELKTWATANNIPQEYIQFGPMGGGPRGGQMGQNEQGQGFGQRGRMRGPGRGMGRGPGGQSGNGQQQPGGPMGGPQGTPIGQNNN